MIFATYNYRYMMKYWCLRMVYWFFLIAGFPHLFKGCNSMKFRQKGLILLILLNVKCPSSYFACKIRIKYFTASKRKKMASWKLNKVKKTNRCDHSAHEKEKGTWVRKRSVIEMKCTKISSEEVMCICILPF